MAMKRYSTFPKDSLSDSDSLVSYQGHSLGGGAVSILQPKLTGLFIEFSCWS